MKKLVSTFFVLFLGVAASACSSTETKKAEQSSAEVSVTEQNESTTTDNVSVTSAETLKQVEAEPTIEELRTAFKPKAPKDHSIVVGEYIEAVSYACATDYFFSSATAVEGEEAVRSANGEECDGTIVELPKNMLDEAAQEGPAGANPALIGKKFTIEYDAQQTPIAITPFDETACSSAEAPAPETPQELNEDQAATFEAVTSALVACDWEKLELQLSDDFSASFGDGEVIDLWQSQEHRSPILLDMVATFSATPIQDEQGVIWPAAHGVGWEEATDTMKEEVEALGYTPEEFDFFSENGYTGYRASIDEAGNWIYFIAGD